VTMTTRIESSNITNSITHWAEFGSWNVDGCLDHGPVPTGEATVVIGDLEFTGTIKRAGEDAPEKPHFVLVGGLGWHTAIARPLSFQNDSGVKLRTVLKNLASAAGITAIEYPTDVTIGRYYECIASRPGHEATYADALNELYYAGYCPSWRVDPDGVTRFGSRAATETEGRHTTLSPNKGVGETTYGIDSPAAFWPGGLIDSVPTKRLEIRQLRSGKLELDAWSTESSPSIRELVRAMVSDLDDPVRTYKVKTCHADGRLDLVPPPDASHLPEMRNVEQWVMGGIMYVADKGDEVMVMFRDRRKTRPAVIGCKLRGSDYRKLARQNDATLTYLPVGPGGIPKPMFVSLGPVTPAGTPLTTLIFMNGTLPGGLPPDGTIPGGHLPGNITMGFARGKASKT
jgi:hypothetical protein